MSNNHYSFEQWCFDNNRQDLLERWDKELNDKLPSQISFKSNNKYWFKCPNGRHESELNPIQYISSGRCADIHCKKCDSFAQHVIDEYGIDYFSRIWNSDNEIDPWMTSYKSSKKALFNCENNHNHIYPQTLCHFTDGVRCGYCHGVKVSHNNSLGSEHIETQSIWSDKNSCSVYDISSHSTGRFWWKCQDGLHPDYIRSVPQTIKQKYICPKCIVERNNLSKKEDITGQRFGELTALFFDKQCSKEQQRPMWRCKCTCGKETCIDIFRLKSGNTKSCGNRTIHYSHENNGNWQGGITSERLSARTSLEYTNWRNSVYKKDWFTCQCCGRSKHITKEAHHLYSFSHNPKLRYDVKNGILLCKECHSAVVPGGFHYIYGVNDNTPEQLEEFINSRRIKLGITQRFSILEYMNGKILKPNEIDNTFKSAI